MGGWVGGWVGDWVGVCVCVCVCVVGGWVGGWVGGCVGGWVVVCVCVCVCVYICMYVHPRGVLMGGLLELNFLNSTRSIATTVSEYRYGWPPERYLPSFCGSNLEKAEDTVKVCSKWNRLPSST